MSEQTKIAARGEVQCAVCGDHPNLQIVCGGCAEIAGYAAHDHVDFAAAVIEDEDYRKLSPRYAEIAKQLRAIAAQLRELPPDPDEWRGGEGNTVWKK